MDAKTLIFIIFVCGIVKEYSRIQVLKSRFLLPRNQNHVIKHFGKTNKSDSMVLI